MTNLDIETAIIVARDLNGIIGRNNRTPWQGELPADMAYFQRVTYGCPVIMGRKTYESLPATLTPLKSRLNVIISRNREYDPRQHSARKDYDPNEVAVVCDFDSALEACLQRNFTRAFVIGGGEIFRLALSHRSATELYVTVVEASFEGDISFPELDPQQWTLSKSWAHRPFDNNKRPFRWEVYERTAIT